MTKKRFFLISFCLPIIIPGLLSIIKAIAPNSPLSNSGISWLLIAGLITGGIQYVLFIALIYFVWLRKKTGDQIAAITFALPLFYLIFAAVLFGLFILLKTPATVHHQSLYTQIKDVMGGALLVFGLFGPPICYAYILLTHMLYFLAKTCNLIKS